MHKNEFYVKDFFSKCDQIHSFRGFPWIWSRTPAYDQMTRKRHLHND